MIKTMEDGSVVLEATVLKVYPTETKNGGFEVRKVKVEFPSKNPDYPNQVLLEQTGNKVSLTNDLKEGKKYRFFIDFLARDWEKTCFGRIQARKIENLNTGNDNGDLPF